MVRTFLQRLRRIDRNSIGWHFAGLILLLSSLVTLVLTSVTLGLDYRHDVAEIERHLQQIELSNVPALSRSAWDMNVEGLQVQLEGILRSPGMEYLEVQLTDGAVIARAGQHTSKRVMQREYLLQYSAWGTPKNLGTLRVEASLDAALQRLKSRVVVILLTQGIKTFIVSAFTLLLFQWLVGRHLAALAGHLSLARSQPGEAQLVLKRAPRAGAHDELDAVVQSLNAMQLRQAALLQALEISEARLASVLDNMVDGVVLIDETGTVLLFNGGAERIFGYSAQEVEGRNVNMLMPAPFHDAHDGYLHRYHTTGVSKMMGAGREVTGLRKNGERFPIELAISEIRSEQGRTVVGCVRDITECKQAQLDLQRSVREKDALLMEVHHRVKNNLQVINSLLQLEARRSTVAQTKEVLGDMQARIRAMALVHESLYCSDTLASVDLASYLTQLATQAFQAQSRPSGGVQLELSLESVHVGMDQAIPCGLLLTELISNCLKHGFPAGATGHIRITLQPQAAPQQWRLRVCDTGVGLPENFEDKRKNSLGLQLVTDLARQLGGNLEMAPNPGKGVAITVNFMLIEPARLVMPV